MSEHTRGMLNVVALKDWWVFDKPKYGTWHLSVPNADGGTGMRFGIQLAGLENWPREEAEAIGYRIRDCLNACVDIPDPESLRRQRDELLAACKACWDYIDEHAPHDGLALPVLNQAVAAINKAEESRT